MGRMACLWRFHSWFYVESNYRICSRCERHQIRLNLAPGKNRWIKVT